MFLWLTFVRFVCFVVVAFEVVNSVVIFNSYCIGWLGSLGLLVLLSVVTCLFTALKFGCLVLLIYLVWFLCAVVMLLGLWFCCLWLVMMVVW